MNISLAIMYLFPHAEPIRDFLVQDDSDGNGAYLAIWNLEEPAPTQEELEQAWADYQALPAPEPVESDSDKIARLEAEKSELENRVAATEDSIVALMDTVLMLMM